MAHLSPERTRLKQRAIFLRKVGWTQQRIADHIGVPRGTLKHWFENGEADKMTKPTLLSWCGKLEDFSPENGVSGWTLCLWEGSL